MAKDNENALDRLIIFSHIAPPYCCLGNLRFILGFAGPEGC